ncbi:MAG: radical SAM protein [Zoogloeaceae bacterium]|jgi:anaerobic ribonucleoside-triphosphate reductase activating protein|nr:radical SAM protein [Zoogloeaceae bacterium]
MATSLLLRLNKAHYPVTVLGYGRRIGLWFQGCRIRCKGCVSQDTWEETAGAWMRVADVLAWCRQKGQEGVDGVTLSGGEPFDQPQALNALLDGIQRWKRRENRNLDVFCYSGYPLKTLQARHGALLKKLDALAPEPYIEALPEGGPWRGSANQPLLPLSPLGEARYGDKNNASPTDKKTLQVSMEDGRIWMIGIPARGDMAALENLCAQRGLRMQAVSWRR